MDQHAEKIEESNAGGSAPPSPKGTPIVAWRFALLAVLAPALLALAAACGEGGEPPTGPRLVMDGDSFDVGAITVGEEVERTIEFRNGGQESLTVSILEIRPAPDAA